LPSSPEPSRRDLIESLRLIKPLFRPHVGVLIAGFIALLGVDTLQLFIPRVIKAAVDDLGGSLATSSSLLKQGMLIAAMGFGVFVCRYGWRRLLLGTSRRVESDLRQRLFDTLLGLDAPFFHKNPPGEIVALASNDLIAVQMAFGMGLVAFVDAVVMTLACIGFMLAMHPFLTLMAVAPLPILAFATAVLSARIHNRFSSVQKRFAALSEFGRQTFAAIRLVKATNIEPRQVEDFDRIGRDYIRDNVRLATVQGVLFPLSGLVANLCLLLVLFFGGRLVIDGAISVGAFVAFVFYLFMLTWPMMAFGWVANLFQRGLTSLSRITRILNTVPALAEPETPLATPDPRGGITIKIRDLSVRPDSGRGMILDRVSLEAGPGLLGIVGRTGAGKSVLASVISRVLPVEDSRYFINGIDVNRLSPAACRSLIAFVPQQSLLFADTVYANIAFGRPGASAAEVEEAARCAAIHDEIMAMASGYQTMIGERGVSLSGGQKQRLALARALLSDRPVLVMDDSLSAVDTATEQEIVKNLRKFFRSRTCIVISHRLAVLREADEIIVLDQGRVSGRGRHEELLESSPYYAGVAAYQGGCRNGLNP